ncbi:MAG: hypothetical protein ACO1NX_01580, partial [Chitinophagaceae bacterium]
MKRFLLFVMLFSGLSLTACGQGSSRTQMVNQLLALETALLKGDKQKVASFFTFPVADESLKAYERALEPKRLKAIRCGHFDVYDRFFAESSGAATACWSRCFR